MQALAFLKRVIPRVLQQRIGRLVRPLWAFVRAVAMARAEVPKDGTISVYYGFRRVPGLEDQAHGGIVKFQRMQDVFPNSPNRFNILYMVSSRMPLDAVEVAWLARKKGARVVWNQNGVAYPAWHGPGWEHTNAPMARLCREADYVFFQSRFCKLSAERFLGDRQGPWEILHNSVDTTVFTPAGTDPAPGRLVLLLGGTQYQYYRLEVGLQVLSEIAQRGVDARMLVMGRLCWIPDEAEAARLARQLAADLGLTQRVTFTGPYTQAEAPSIFRHAHLLLHTKYNDPCPGLVVEAMACGLPVVYSKSGGVPELVGEEAGIGVPAEMSWERDIPPDPKAMADAVLQVAARRAQFADAARTRAVEKFDLQPWIARHVEVFGQLVK